MTENRYDKNLREGNQLIIDLSPANYVERIVLSLELKKALGNKTNANVLEIGIGEGDLTKHILKHNPAIKLDAVDISPEMIEIAKGHLAEYRERVTYHCDDALAFLQKSGKKYDAIVSSWVIHNFKKSDQQALIAEIFAQLNSGGVFILFDKVYPDDQLECERLFNLQIKRYDYLANELRNEIIDHEKQDFISDYRITESSFLQTLREIGFKDIRIADRVERDIVLIAK